MTFWPIWARTPITEFSITEPFADHAAVGDQAVRDRRPRDPRARQVAGRVKTGLSPKVKSKGGIVAGQVDVRLVERPDGPDVFPVAVEQVGLHPVLGDRLRENLVAEVGRGSRSARSWTSVARLKR